MCIRKTDGANPLHGSNRHLKWTHHVRNASYSEYLYPAFWWNDPQDIASSNPNALLPMKSMVAYAAWWVVDRTAPLLPNGRIQTPPPSWDGPPYGPPSARPVLPSLPPFPSNQLCTSQTWLPQERGASSFCQCCGPEASAWFGPTAIALAWKCLMALLCQCRANASGLHQPQGALRLHP